ncbi:aromatic acid exporter family protein [Anaerosporobacter sp.]
MNRIRNLDYFKLIKFGVGALLASAIATFLNVQYSLAAGIIALLTIQDTKKETVIIATKRVVIFFIMTTLSAIIMPLVGYNLISLGIIMFPYLFFCLVLNMKEAIAPIAVLCTHYITSKSCSVEMIINEFLILVIGAGTGIILNLFMVNTKKQIRDIQKEIDETISGIIKRMSINILMEDKSKYTGSCFEELEALLERMRKESLNYMNNHFYGTNDYYYKYMQLRLVQGLLLKRIFIDIKRLEYTTAQAKRLSEFLYKICEEFDEVNDAICLLRELNKLSEFYKSEKLPETRMEFENRAVLYHILEDLREFIEAKKKFSESLTLSEREEYWCKG